MRTRRSGPGIKHREVGAMGSIRIGSIQVRVTGEEIEAADAFIQNGVPDWIVRIA
jgi:hypothetical protein